MSATSDIPTILCVGRLYCDIVFTDLPRLPSAGTEVFAGGVGLHAGGGAAICAGHLAALGHRSALAAYWPAGGLKAPIEHDLARMGIHVGLCRKSDADTDLQLTVALVQDEERAFVTHRTGGAFPYFTVEAAKRLSVTHIHVGEATTLIENPSLIDTARALGASLSLDCSWDDHLDAAKLATYLPEVDVFLPNAAEVAFLAERGILVRDAKLTVVKQGPDGAIALMGGGDLHVPAEPVSVLDSTGAGDAFNAGFLSAWLQKAPLAACLAQGNAQGAFAVQHRGGLGGLDTLVQQKHPLDERL